MLSSGGSRLSDKGVGYPSASASDSDDPVFADENGDVLILLTPIPSRLRLRFLIFTRSKRSYDSAYDSVASENQPWGKVRQLILSAIEGKKKTASLPPRSLNYRTFASSTGVNLFHSPSSTWSDDLLLSLPGPAQLECMQWRQRDWSWLSPSLLRTTIGGIRVGVETKWSGQEPWNS